MLPKLNPNYKQLHIFISNINGIVGQTLAEQLRTDNITDEVPHILIGTVIASPLQKNNAIPKGVNKIIKEKNETSLSEALFECEIIIYELEDNNLDEIEFALKICKLGSFAHDKIFLLISSMMVWSRTQTKEKRFEGDGSDVEEVDDKGNKTFYYTEQDFALRRGFSKYERYKELENYCFFCNNVRDNLKTYVICPGIIYGHGENQFYQLFRRALQGEELSVFNEGLNTLPTIHVTDLGKLIAKVITELPIQNYIFAIDHAKNQTQKSIFQAISIALSDGKLKNASLLEGGLADSYDV